MTCNAIARLVPVVSAGLRAGDVAVHAVVVVHKLLSLVGELIVVAQRLRCSSEWWTQCHTGQEDPTLETHKPCLLGETGK